MISIDFSQSIISGNAPMAENADLGHSTPFPGHWVWEMQDQDPTASSGLQQDQTQGIKHSRTNSAFGMFQYQTSSSSVLTLNSNSISGNLPKSVNQDLGVPGVSGMGQGSSAPKDVMQGKRFQPQILTLLWKDLLLQKCQGTLKSEPQRICSGKQQILQDSFHLKSSDPAWTEHPSLLL